MEKKVSKTISQDNMTKLRALTEKLNKEDNTEYRFIIKKLKKIVDGGKDEIKVSKDPKDKIKCYETMCKSITNLLEDIKIK